MIFVLLTSLIFAIAVQEWIWKLFTFRVPLVPKKENHIPFYILAAIHLILTIIIFKWY